MCIRDSIITWSQNDDDDFQSYTLIESDSEDMSNHQEILTTEDQTDTSYSHSIEIGVIKYYQVITKDIWELQSVSNIDIGSSLIQFVQTFGGSDDEDGYSVQQTEDCLLYTSDAADDLTRVDLGGRRIIKKKNDETNNLQTERFFFSSRRRHTRFALVSWARRCV